MTAYYNEIDPYAAQWLRNLIAAGHIPPGDVDERSIVDVSADDLRGYGQCHFFAGIGGWALALDLAGWPRDRQAWTGSCPCQPFSSAGAGKGFDDERHLWPVWQRLIEECRPSILFGEQVASSAVGPWLDLVQDDLEALGYAFGAIAFPAASVGAPHIRDRTYWVGITTSQRRERFGSESKYGIALQADEGKSQWLANMPRVRRAEERPTIAETRCNGSAGDFSAWRMGNTDSKRARWECGAVCGSIECENREYRANDVIAPSAICRMADASCEQHQRWNEGSSDTIRRKGSGGGTSRHGDDYGAGPVNGHWRAADWIGCRDGKWRPVEPGTFPLAHGLPGRVGRLRAYGNAIVPQQAAEFIQAVMGVAP